MGVLHPDDLIASFVTHNARRPNQTTYCTSMFSLPGRTARQLAALANQPHFKVRLSTRGAVRAAGFEIRLTNSATGHCDVFLEGAEDQLANDDQVKRLIAAFGPPIDNPERKVG